MFRNFFFSMTKILTSKSISRQFFRSFITGNGENDISPESKNFIILLKKNTNLTNF